MMRTVCRGTGWRSVCFIVLFWCGFVPNADAEYRLGSGDVIEISVFKVPELTRRTSVDVEGRIAFPPLGLIDASDKNLNELGERLRNLLISRDITIDPQITIALIEARPVYVNGDVTKPGSYAYQAGLTVRHGIALAGGLDLSRSRGAGNPLAQAAELRSEQAVLWVDLTRSRARAARLKAELNGGSEISSQDLGETPVSPQTISEIMGLEIQQRKANQEEYSKERSHLERIVELVQAKIAALMEQKSKEEEGLSQQLSDVEKIRALLERGLASSSRIAEEQRALLYARTRVSETTAQVSLARRELDEAKRKLQNLDERRRISFTSELQDAVISMEKIRLQLKGMQERMVHLAPVELGKPRITVYRRSGTKQVGHAVDEDSEILPGDVVEVALPSTIESINAISERNLSAVPSVKADDIGSGPQIMGQNPNKGEQRALANSGRVRPE